MTSRRSLLLGLAALALVLAGSVGTALYLEAQPGIQRYSGEKLPSETESSDWETALDLFHKGNYDGAEAELRKLTRTHPGMADAWQLLGVTLFRRNRMEEAEQTFRHLVRQQPFQAAGYNNLSQTLLRLNRVPEALEMIQQAAELAPDNITVLMNLAALLAREKMDREAVAPLRRAVRRGVRPEAITRYPDLVRLMNDPGFMKLYEEERRKAGGSGEEAPLLPARSDAAAPSSGPGAGYDEYGLLHQEPGNGGKPPQE